MKSSHSLLQILLTSLKLGLTSFGGPIAHLGYFKDVYIDYWCRIRSAIIIWLH